MSLKNTKDGYGTFTKIFHWLIVLFFILQYLAANIMIRIEGNETFVGLSQGFFYNWHKSLGLIALAIAIARLINRHTGRLPDWAPTLTKPERGFIHHVERVLYICMFLMPVSGYIYVMSGGYGVNFFGIWHMPNPIGKVPALETVSKWTHIVASFVLLAAISGHLFVVLRHQFILRDGLVRRMLPASDR